MKMAGDALGGHKDEGDQGYNNQGYQQGRPEGIPVGGGGYEGGQQGYGGNQFEGQYEVLFLIFFSQWWNYTMRCGQNQRFKHQKHPCPRGRCYDSYSTL